MLGSFKTEKHRKIIFVHQAKAAGTSLVQIFNETYGPENVYHDVDNQGLWQMSVLRRIIELKIQPLRRYKNRSFYRVIHGHFRANKYRRAFPDAFYLTFFRHPVQQLVSNYYYWLRKSNPTDIIPLRRWVYETKPSLVEFVSKWSMNIDLKMRVKNLNIKNFDFVGIAERFNDSIELLLRQFPELEIQEGAERVNPEKKVGERYNLSQDEETRINDILSPLVIQYENAVNRFESEWDAVSKLYFVNELNKTGQKLGIPK